MQKNLLRRDRKISAGISYLSESYKNRFCDINIAENNVIKHKISFNNNIFPYKSTNKF